jgi:NADPH:quinone reductase-like Zn-dependent oxidoreductase
MKAILCTKYGPPEVLKLKEVETPTPKDDEVRIRIHASAVTASDCIIRGFNAPPILWIPMGIAVGFTRPRQPILGIVFAGELESVGRGVKKFTEGDAVFGWDLFPGFGSYAEYKCLHENGFIVKKPANVSYEEAAAIPYGGLMALPFLKKGNIQDRRKVLIYGASGAIGTIAVQLAKYYGAEVTGVSSAKNLEMVRSLGADKMIDYTKADCTGELEQYDLVLDAVGKKKRSELKKRSKKALTKNGRYISVDSGFPKQPIEDLILLKELLEAGTLKPVIDRTYPLDQMVEAHRYVDKGHKRGNVIITVAKDQ